MLQTRRFQVLSCFIGPLLLLSACGSETTPDGADNQLTNECADASLNDCDGNAVCTDAAVGFSCVCNVGYTGDGKACADIDECVDAALNSCDSNATCTNDAGSFACTCNLGSVGDGTACSDVDACSDAAYNDCDPNADCIDGTFSYSCSCLSGFTGDGNTCVDDDECADSLSNDCDVNAICTNEPGSFSCACKLGTAGDGTTCADVDACSDPLFNNCDSNAVCTDDVLTFTCVCVDGYDGNGVECVDVDECADRATYACDANANCVNEPGTYGCACKLGYDGDGLSCADVDACSETRLNDCDPVAECVDGVGDFTCTCPQGFTGDGFTCADVDECADVSLNGCDMAAQTCFNTPGEHVCLCPSPNSYVSGACQATRVLVLQEEVDANADIISMLTTAGYTVTDGGYYGAWDGTANSTAISPADFDTVLWLEGINYGVALSVEANTALLAFVQAGGGLVRTEWGGYSDTDNVDFLPLLPVAYADDYDYGSAWTVVSASDPLAAGLPATFTIPEAGYSYVDLKGGAVAPIVNEAGYPLATYWTMHAGTVVHLNHDVGYSVTPLDTNANILFRNAVHFSGQTH